MNLRTGLSFGIAVNSNAARIAAKNRLRASKIESEIRRGVIIGSRPILAQSHAIGQGGVPGFIFNLPLTQGGLAHPYGFGPIGSLGPRGAQPYGSTPIINFQKGVFDASWGISISVVPGLATLRLYNTAPYARALNDGTPVMKGRNFIAFIHQKQDQRFSLTVRAAFQRAWLIR